MKHIHNCIVLFFVFYCAVGFSQDLRLKSKTERIVVKQDSSFVKEVTIFFEASESLRFYPIFYDTELERIMDIELFEQKRKRFKKLVHKRISEEDVELDYITSKKIKVVHIPPEKNIQLTYRISCSELMYFTRLHFFSYNEVDTLNYTVQVPNEFKLVHDSVHLDSLTTFVIDSTKTDRMSEWNIKVVPQKVKADPMQLFGIYKNMKVPFMRTLVMPTSYEGSPTDYMNDWYVRNAAPRKGLPLSAMEKIDELTKGVSDKQQIINIIYNYVRTNFKYVAIEVGMGAFIPSAAAEVFENKQGDCKDLSNFLSEALKYKGIESDIALASTFDHISDCDFPTLSSANHVIGVAYVDGETVLLDPTDPIHYEGSPVQSLQDRTILIVNPKGGTFHKVTPFSPKQNEILYQLDVNIDSNSMLISGDFSIDYKGITSNSLKAYLKFEGEKEFNSYGKKLYEAIFGNQSISELKVTNETKKLRLDGKIAINGKTFNDGNSKYLFIDFLPRLFDLESRETLIEGTYIRSPFYKKIRTNIKLDEPIVTFEPIVHTYQGEGMSLTVTIKSVSNLALECNYDFTFDHIFINAKNSDSTNEILKSFKKIINEPIVLKKQKS